MTNREGEKEGNKEYFQVKKVKIIKVGASIFEENDRVAEDNRKILEESGVFFVNIMGSPGSGKTSVLEKTVMSLKEKGYRIAVVEGDIKGSIDGQRLMRLGIPVVQINTGGACHLDANMVKKGIEHLDIMYVDILFVENVGNLVCPAEFTLGEDINVIVSSVPEGEEKPLKYPLMFRCADICLLNKVDLVKYTDFNMELFHRFLLQSAPSVKFLPLSAKTGEGFYGWIDCFLSTMNWHKETKVMIVGLGDRMRKDDAAGCEAAEQLTREIKKNNIKVINAENIIENYLGAIERFKPTRLFVIDALDFGGNPGEVKIFKPHQVKDTTSSTHNFSLSLIIEHIIKETGARCEVIGIQPETIGFGEGLSISAEKGIKKAVKMVQNRLLT